MLPATATPDERFRHWLLLNTHRLAQKAEAAIDGDGAPCSAFSAVKTSQFRGLHNTARMCASAKELRTFIRSRAERREAAEKDGQASFWAGLRSELSALNSDLLPEAVRECEIPPRDSNSIQQGSFDEETAEVLIARAFIDHFSTHCQFASARDA